MQTDFYDQTNNQKPQSCFSLEEDSADDELSISQQDVVSPAPIPSETKIQSAIEENLIQGNYAVAISLIDLLIARHPESAVNYNNRGLIYYQNNQIVEALNDLTHALEINPKLDSAYNNRGNCHAALGDSIAAISDYDIALDINPGNLRAWINQGITYREINSYDLALENFDIALILSDRLQENIYAERGRTYHLRGDWNCAVADYQIALELLSLLEDISYQHKVQTWLDDLLNPITN